MCQQLGIHHHFIHKKTPNENAVIERSFRTDEEEFCFFMQRAPKYYDELHDWFRDYLHFYNTQRPHLGPKMKTPLEVAALIMKD